MTTYLDRKNFAFISKALPEDTFEVVKFNGTEAISRPYEFSVTLSARDPDLNLKSILRKPATLQLSRGGEAIPIHGIPASFEQLHEANQRVFYRAVLVPKLWYLGMYHENRLFLDKSLPQVIEEILKESGLTTQDYELKLTRSYSSWEYMCQYRESNLDFISRWMEHEGLYYFFKQQENGEKLVIADNLNVHENVHGEATLSYSPVAGLIPEDEEIVTGFVCRQNVLPKKVVLKDYNYRKPTLEVKAEADVDPNGREEVYIYGEHFKDPNQGKDLAKIRAGEFLCRETVYYGESSSPRLAPGFLFELAKHYRGQSNRKYLVTEVEHRGSGTGMLLSGMGQDEAQNGMQPGYSNRFVCIPSDVQFRPERKTLKPRFNGTMNAVIDAAGDGSTAELDDQGRYKVILPFDLSGRKGGKASRWIRMAQPYSGSNYGSHFPLHKGSEVLLTFIDGDPDRPIISAAVPNPHTQSPVTSANQTKSVIRDNFGNEIIMDATPGDEHIRLHSPHHASSIEIGRSVTTRTKSDQFRATMGNDMEAMIGMKGSAVAGAAMDFVVGSKGDVNIGPKFEFSAGGTHDIKAGYEWEYAVGPKRHLSHDDVNLISEKDNIIIANDSLCMIGGAKILSKNDSTSILLADEDKISLALGPKKKPITPGTGKGLYAWTILANAAAIASAALVTTATTKGTNTDTPKVDRKWGEEFGISATVLFALQFALLRPLLQAAKKAEDAPHVVTQDNPVAEIKLEKEGEITIHSTKKKAALCIGTREFEDTRITLLKTEASMESGKPAVGAKGYASQITAGANGKITIRGKDEVTLTSRENEITLSSPRQINLMSPFIKHQNLWIRGSYTERPEAAPPPPEPPQAAAPPAQAPASGGPQASPRPSVKDLAKKFGV